MTTKAATNGTDPLRQLWQDTRVPPAEKISRFQRGQRGPVLDYEGHADVTEDLLEHDVEWKWEPLPADLLARLGEERALVRNDKGQPVGLWILLTVHGHQRIGYGSVEPGKSDAVKELIGDAIRNAALRFGVAVTLWSKAEKTEGGGEPPSETPPGPPPAPTPAPEAPPPVDPMAPEWAQRLRGVLNALPGDVRANVRPVLLDLILGEPFPTTEKQGQLWEKELRSRGLWPVDAIERQRQEALERVRCLAPETADRLRDEQLEAHGSIDWSTITAEQLAWVHRWIDANTSAVVPAS